MASIIAKSASGKIWKDANSGKIIKAKPISEDVIQSGLAFWGRSDLNYLTIVDGLVSEAFDVRETNFISPIYGKMIQNTAAYRPYYSSGVLEFSGANNKLIKVSQTYKSIFLVFKPTSTSSRFKAFNSYSNFNGAEGTLLYNKINNINSAFYKNLTKFTSTATFDANNVIVYHTLSDINISNASFTLGFPDTAFSRDHLFEWGWYNRPLTEIEVIYNINALKKRYNIV